MAGTIRDLLQHTPSPFKELIHGDQNTSLKEACSLLQTNNISSLPILDTTKNEYVGLIDITDICLFVVYAYAQKHDAAATKQGDNNKDNKDKDKGGELFSDVSAIDLLQISDEGSRAWSFLAEDSVKSTMDAYSKGIHRALVKFEGNPVQYHIISQRDAVKFLYESKQYDSIFNSKLSDLPQLFLYRSKLVTIDVHSLAIDGFKKIGREHFGAVAVVDSDGNIVSSLCATDLRSIDSTVLASLYLPVDQYLKSIHHGVISKPLTTTLDETLGHVVEKIIQNKDHRVWVLDAKGKLKEVLTLSDICKVFLD